MDAGEYALSGPGPIGCRLYSACKALSSAAMQRTLWRTSLMSGTVTLPDDWCSNFSGILYLRSASNWHACFSDTALLNNAQTSVRRSKGNARTVRTVRLCNCLLDMADVYHFQLTIGAVCHKTTSSHSFADRSGTAVDRSSTTRSRRANSGGRN